MFRFENVSKRYTRRGQTVTALSAKTLEIASGSYVAIVGPSGSGKTTLLSMLGGMLAPSEGRILFDGVSIYDLAVTERARIRQQRIGFVFQTFNLISYLNALENVQVPMFLGGLPSNEQKDRAAALLEQMGLADRLEHKPSELSVGQQQRVALARTLANDPTVVLADEPTGNLDPESRENVLGFFDRLNRDGKTIVMVTHDMNAAQRSQRQLWLRNGEITVGNQPSLGQAA
jgi:putative ABC transport system ATP-binding protein